MRQYYFSWLRGMQVPCRFYVKKYKGNITIRVGKYEILIYKPQIYKIRVEVY